jgi:hypothetical protein
MSAYSSKPTSQIIFLRLSKGLRGSLGNGTVYGGLGNVTFVNGFLFDRSIALFYIT